MVHTANIYEALMPGPVVLSTLFINYCNLHSPGRGDSVIPVSHNYPYPYSIFPFYEEIGMNNSKKQFDKGHPGSS